MKKSLLHVLVQVFGERRKIRNPEKIYKCMAGKERVKPSVENGGDELETVHCAYTTYIYMYIITGIMNLDSIGHPRIYLWLSKKNFTCFVSCTIQIRILERLRIDWL